MARPADPRDLLARATAEDPGAPDETAERILDAALEQAESFGLRRFTMEDVARRSRVSRVTVYRWFPKKDRLLDALVMREIRTFLEVLDSAIGTRDGPEDKLVEGLVVAMTYLRGHRLLTRLLQTEPELLLPHLTVDGGPALAALREFVAWQARTEIEAGRLRMREPDVDGIAEILVRITLSFVIAPATVLDVDDPEALRAIARRYLGPVIAALDT